MVNFRRGDALVECDSWRAGVLVLTRVGERWERKAVGEGRDVREHEQMLKSTTSESLNLLAEGLHAKWWYEKESSTPTHKLNK